MQETEYIFIKSHLGNTVTVMSPEGKPIQINASSLQTAEAQNAMGMLIILRIKFFHKYGQDCQLGVGDSTVSNSPIE